QRPVASPSRSPATRERARRAWSATRRSGTVRRWAPWSSRARNSSGAWTTCGHSSVSTAAGSRRTGKASCATLMQARPTAGCSQPLPAARSPRCLREWAGWTLVMAGRHLQQDRTRAFPSLWRTMEGSTLPTVASTTGGNSAALLHHREWSPLVIRFGVVLSVVLVALGLLVGGVLTSSLLLVYLAIGVAAAAGVLLAIGVVIWREEIFGAAPRTGRAEVAGLRSADVAGSHEPEPESEPIRQLTPPPGDGADQDQVSSSAAAERSAQAETAPAGTGAAGDGPGRDSAAGDSAGRDSAGRDSAGRDSAGRDSAGRDSAGRDSAGRDSAAPDSAGRGRAGRGGARP